jgi:FkbM family methyltransferase
MNKLFFANSIKSILKKFKIGITSYDNLIFPHHTKEFIHKQILQSSSGVLHVGAHFGEERDFYHQMKLNVFWVEAVPEFFKKLKNNISTYPDQIAANYLLGNHDKKIVKFYLANNEGSSSSVFKLTKDNGFQGLEMNGAIEIEMRRLDKVLKPIQVDSYPNWIIDAQGAELDVLKGAGKLLDQVSSIMVEVSTREIYKGGTNYLELKEFLREFNFIPIWEPKNNSHEDVLFIRTA